MTARPVAATNPVFIGFAGGSSISQSVTVPAGCTGLSVFFGLDPAGTIASRTVSACTFNAATLTQVPSSRVTSTDGTFTSGRVVAESHAIHGRAHLCMHTLRIIARRRLDLFRYWGHGHRSGKCGDRLRCRAERLEHAARQLDDPFRVRIPAERHPGACADASGAIPDWVQRRRRARRIARGRDVVHARVS